MINQSPGNEAFIMTAVTLISNMMPIRIRAFVALSNLSFIQSSKTTIFYPTPPHPKKKDRKKKLNPIQ